MLLMSRRNMLEDCLHVRFHEVSFVNLQLHETWAADERDRGSALHSELFVLSSISVCVTSVGIKKLDQRKAILWLLTHRTVETCTRDGVEF